MWPSLSDSLSKIKILLCRKLLVVDTVAFKTIPAFIILLIEVVSDNAVYQNVLL